MQVESPFLSNETLPVQTVSSVFCAVYAIVRLSPLSVTLSKQMVWSVVTVTLTGAILPIKCA